MPTAWLKTVAFAPSPAGFLHTRSLHHDCISKHLFPTKFLSPISTSSLDAPGPGLGDGSYPLKVKVKLEKLGTLHGHISERHNPQTKGHMAGSEDKNSSPTPIPSWCHPPRHEVRKAYYHSSSSSELQPIGTQADLWPERGKAS